MATPSNDHLPAERTHAATPAVADRFENPGLPPHIPRRADVDERAARRAALQVVVLFTLSALASIAFVVLFFAMDPELKGYVIGIGQMNLYHLALGLTMAVSLLGIGFGAIHWAKTLMPDEEVVEERHLQASPEEDRSSVAQTLSHGYRSAQLNRRTAILGAGAGAMGLFALPLILP
ncbi:MAG: ubiquinol-cytochrome C reductase, partial [Mobilicoccus sp.]|nr:ubiquinol-cytochrome C reductase [Mobilicoccus sp.]